MAAFYFHAGEVLAFELTLRALNDYHLKEVHMMKLPGLFYHCDMLNLLLKEEIPRLWAHFEKKKVRMLMLAANWIVCIMTQCIPLSLVQRFLSLFWMEGWPALYRLILCIF